MSNVVSSMVDVHKSFLLVPGTCFPLRQLKLLITMKPLNDMLVAFLQRNDVLIFINREQTEIIFAQAPIAARNPMKLFKPDVFIQIKNLASHQRLH